MANHRLRKELIETARGLCDLGAVDGKTMREIESLRLEEPRVVRAPAPVTAPDAPLPSNRVLSVGLQPGERIQWIWTSSAGAGSYVSGYTITKVD